MSIFSNILAKLGFGKDKADTQVASTAPAGTAPAGTAPASPSTPDTSGAPAVKPISQVDVVAKLEQLASQHPEKLNWKTSIVDLLKLIGLDSSYGARKELATELHCPADKMGDSAQMNMWLHKTVLNKLAENGGNIPAELLN